MLLIHCICSGLQNLSARMLVPKAIFLTKAWPNANTLSLTAKPHLVSEPDLAYWGSLLFSGYVSLLLTARTNHFLSFKLFSSLPVEKSHFIFEHSITWVYFQLGRNMSGHTVGTQRLRFSYLCTQRPCQKQILAIFKLCLLCRLLFLL